MTFIKFGSEDYIPHVSGLDSCQCSCVVDRVEIINGSGLDACEQADIDSSVLPSIISA